MLVLAFPYLIYFPRASAWESSRGERVLLILKVGKMQNRIYFQFSRIEVVRSFEEEGICPHFGVVPGTVGLASFVPQGGESHTTDFIPQV